MKLSIVLAILLAVSSTLGLYGIHKSNREGYVKGCTDSTTIIVTSLGYKLINPEKLKNYCEDQYKESK